MRPICILAYSIALATGVSFVALSSGCAWEDDGMPSPNGATSTLFLSSAWYQWADDHGCGEAPAEPTHCAERPLRCWSREPAGEVYDLQVARRVLVRSGNGLGDSNTAARYEPLWLDGTASVVVTPPDAASAELRQVCGDALRLDLQVHSAEPFEIEVEAGAFVDSWTLQLESDAPCDGRPVEALCLR